MKQRSGFVSNSSSSSFILCFNKDPMNKDNLAAEMGVCTSFEEHWNHTVEICSEVIIDNIYKKLIAAGPATDDKIEYELNCSIPWGISRDDPTYPKWKDGKDDEYYAKVDEWNNNFTTTNEEFVAFRQSMQGKHVYIIEFEDDTTSEAMYETGKPFRNIETVLRVSHH